MFAVKAAIIASTGGLLFGYDIGVVAGALPELAHDMRLNLGQQDMVVSIMVAGAIAGQPVSSYVATEYKSTTAIQCSAVLYSLECWSVVC